MSRYGVLGSELGKVGPVGAGQLAAGVALGELLGGGYARILRLTLGRGHQAGKDRPLRHLNKKLYKDKKTKIYAKLLEN